LGLLLFIAFACGPVFAWSKASGFGLVISALISRKPAGYDAEMTNPHGAPAEPPLNNPYYQHLIPTIPNRHFFSFFT
jgi:hypothetical protein